METELKLDLPAVPAPKEKAMYHAYAWKNGMLQVGKSVPEGAIEIASDTQHHLRQRIHAIGRLAHDNKTWLVPGIPEARTDKQRMNALVKFTKQFRGEKSWK